MSAEIEKATGQEVTLIGGSGGIFEIRADGNLLWKKERGGAFPADGEGAALFSQS
ncbi:hypothetical protein JIN77_08725 [Verrucomicrobiaceae bacterium R5-34]|uniref:SelT/SelW/SelH family protein n=1 Tax=Oceaniferula flava TaxID=2800421 RepID=A0AAE2VAA3_9BACT|nr:hypothetical protein [Verrucomicrobiaceae bacterium R5-34]MBK1856453.1 hypothetical protein [Oceaniferula flavus]MBM1137760.1 hypothetical protein [Oceaniferula flavus]